MLFTWVWQWFCALTGQKRKADGRTLRKVLPFKLYQKNYNKKRRKDYEF